MERQGAGAPERAPAKWYYNVWFVLFMLFVAVGPLGLPLVWKSPAFSRRMKWVLTVLVVVATILAVTFSADVLLHTLTKLQDATTPW